MRSARAILVPLLLATLAADAAAQYTMVSPRRLVQLYDFEETNDAGVKFGQGLPMPRYWYVIGRDPMAEDANFMRLPLHDQLALRQGYPQYNRVGYRSDQKASGEYSLGLDLEGGDAGAYLEVGALPAVPESDYLVTAKVRTAVLRRGGAVLSAYFIDDNGAMIRESVRTTTPIRTEEAWASVSVRLSGEFTKAAYLGIEARVVQPEPDPDHPLGDQQVVLRDVRGQAWFDDIAVWQLPSVQIATQSPVNLIRAPEAPQVHVSVRDLTGQNLFARVTVYDLDGDPVAQDIRPVLASAPATWRWTPALPGYGWYLTELAVFDDSESKLPDVVEGALVSDISKLPVARTYGAMLVLPPESPPVASDALRFTLDAEGIPEEQIALLPGIIEGTGLRSVVVSAWDRRTTSVDVVRRLRALDDALSGAMGSGDRVAVSFHPVPDLLETTDGVNSDDPLVVFAAPSDRWMPFVQPVLLKLGQWVRDWRMGDPTHADTTLDPGLAATLANARRSFDDWTPEPVFALPSRLDFAPRQGVSASVSYAIQWPEAVTPEALRDHLQPWLDAKRPVALRIEVPPADQVPHADRVTDLLLRLFAAWEAGDDVAVTLGPRWTRAMERRYAVLPDPLLGVFANTVRRLSDRRIVGRLDLGYGLHCLILDGKAGGALIAWNEYGNPGDGLDMYLGPNPVAIDCWGNRAAVAFEDGRHRLALGRTPVFIEGIDPQLALFRAGFKLNEPFIPSRQTPHERTITITNPWGSTINGRFTITEPAAWSVNPQRQVFSLAPGRSVTLPVVLGFPVNEQAGDKRLSARFELQTDRTYELDLSAPMTLGLEHVRFEASLRLDRQTNPGQTDAIATCIVTNTGTEDLSLNVFAFHDSHPYAERLIPRLEPGQSVIKTFRFLDSGVSIRQNPVLVGVRETNGPAVLNRHLTLTDLR